MNKFLSITILLFCSLSLQGEGEAAPRIDRADPIPVQPSSSSSFQADNLFATELCYLLTPVNLRDDLPTTIATGGSLLYEFYGQNRLFQKQTLPGTIIGLILTTNIFYIKESHREDLKNVPLFNGGGYLGYQFLIELTEDITLAPRFYGGVKYYMMTLYFLENEQIITPNNPIFLGGIGLNMILRNQLNLSLSMEYNLFYEGQNPGHTFRLSSGAGILF